MLVTAVYCELLSCSFSTLHWQRGRPVVSGQSPQSLWWLLVFQASIRSIYTQMVQSLNDGENGSNGSKICLLLLTSRTKRGKALFYFIMLKKRYVTSSKLCRRAEMILKRQKRNLLSTSTPKGCRVWNLQLSASETESMVNQWMLITLVYVNWLLHVSLLTSIRKLSRK